MENNFTINRKKKRALREMNKLDPLTIVEPHPEVPERERYRRPEWFALEPSPRKSTKFGSHAKGARRFLRGTEFPVRAARGEQMLKTLFEEAGIPENIYKNQILARLNNHNFASVGTNEPTSSDPQRYFYRAKRRCLPLSKECIRQLDDIYRVPPGLMSTPAVRRIKLLDIFRKCTLSYAFNGTNSWDNSAYREISRIHPHLLFLRMDVPENRVKMFYKDMQAVVALASRYGDNDRGTPSRTEVKEIVSRNYPTPSRLPVKVS